MNTLQSRDLEFIWRGFHIAPNFIDRIDNYIIIDLRNDVMDNLLANQTTFAVFIQQFQFLNDEYNP
jgi:hypothetical protein